MLHTSKNGTLQETPHCKKNTSKDTIHKISPNVSHVRVCGQVKLENDWTKGNFLLGRKSHDKIKTHIFSITLHVT